MMRMKKRWYHVTAVLAAAAIFSGMNGFGREACLAKETVPAGTEGVGAQAAAEPLMYGIGSTSKDASERQSIGPPGEDIR